MKYDITKKSVKQSIKNMSDYFNSRGFKIPLNVISEGFSKGLFFKDWNTLSGLFSRPGVINHYPSDLRKYLFEIECDIDVNILHQMLLKAFSNYKCNAVVNNIISDSVTHHFEISFLENNSNNFLTSLIVFTNSLKKYNVTRCDVLRIEIKKESLLEALNL